jgi:hypothetical protein
MLFSVTQNLILLSPKCDLNSIRKVHVGVKNRLTVTTKGNLTCEINISSIFTTDNVEIQQSNGKVLFRIHNTRTFKKGNKHCDAKNLTHIYTCYKAEKFWKESFTEYAACLPTEVTSFSKNTDSSAERSTCTFLCQLPKPFLDTCLTISNYIA